MACLTTMQLSRWFRSVTGSITLTTTSQQILSNDAQRVAWMVWAANGTSDFHLGFGVDAIVDASYRVRPSVDSPRLFHLAEFGDVAQKSVTGIMGAGTQVIGHLQILATEEMLSLPEPKIRELIFGK